MNLLFFVDDEALENFMSTSLRKDNTKRDQKRSFLLVFPYAHHFIKRNNNHAQKEKEIDLVKKSMTALLLSMVEALYIAL